MEEAIVGQEWFHSFFTELPNEFWRRAIPPEATAADVAFIEQRLELQPGSRILDVPCGSGRHTLALAARGHHLTGLDISPEAIDHARAQATTEGLDVEFHVADMRAAASYGQFDAALCLGNSFGYLDLAGTEAFARSLAQAVRPGGRLVIDFNGTAESVLPEFSAGQREIHTGDITVTATSRYDANASVLYSDYLFQRGDQQLRATAHHHVYTSGHIGEMLTKAGFTGITRYADTQGTPFTIGAGRLLLTARRAE